MFSEENYVPPMLQLVQEIRVHSRLIFKDFIVWWPGKLGQGHQNLINSFNYSKDTIHKVWPDLRIYHLVQVIGCSQNLTFKVLVWPWKWGQGHQNLSIAIGENPPIGSGDRVQTRLIFTVFIGWWLWKLVQGQQNLINTFNYPNDTIPKVWPESIIWFES